MRLGRGAALVAVAAWIVVAVVAVACGGDPFSTAPGDAGSGSDALALDTGLDARGLDAQGLDGGPAADHQGAPDTGHAEAAGVEAGSADGPTPHDGPGPGTEGGPWTDVVTIEAGASDAITIGPTKTVFVTSNAFSGDLGGLAGADATCQQLATSAKLTGTYKAWLSSSTTTAAQRLTHGTGPYALMNGVVVAAGWTALTSGTLLVPINVNEKGGPPPTASSTCGSTNPSIVWTATAPDGTLAAIGATCADWTTSGPSGGSVLGLADHADKQWTDGCASVGASSTICGASAALYCIEQ